MSLNEGFRRLWSSQPALSAGIAPGTVIKSNMPKLQEAPYLEGTIPNKRSSYKGICVINQFLNCIDPLC